MRLAHRLGVVLLLVLAPAPAGAEPAPSPEPTATPAAGLAVRLRRFELRPTWDEGIQYRIGAIHERQRMIGPDLPADRTFVSGRLGARFHLDAADFARGGDAPIVDGGFELRRAFVNLGGEIALRWPVRYYFEFGVINERAYLDRGWFDVQRPGSLLVLGIGAYYAPLGLDQLTSSNAITFLERAQPVQAFAPGTKAGLQLSRVGADGAVGWAFGAFTDTQRTDAADRSEGPARIVGRLTWLPPVLADSTRERRVHLGVAGQWIFGSSASVRHKATPESFLAPPLVDTGTIAASHAVVPALELAVQQGPFLLQSEYLASIVAPDDGDTTLFWGTYVAASALLTGETRPYDRRRRAFGMVEPAVPFSPRERRWRGAFEIGARYSYLDLDAGRIAGGCDHAVSVGLNWYWNRHVRLMADYGITVVGGDRPDGTLQVFQSRLQLVY